MQFREPECGGSAARRNGGRAVDRSAGPETSPEAFRTVSEVDFVNRTPAGQAGRDATKPSDRQNESYRPLPWRIALSTPPGARPMSRSLSRSI
jgi:hypothetical protein